MPAQNQITVEITGVQALLAQLQRAKGAWGRAVRKAAPQMEREAIAYWRSLPWPRRTGRLQRSLVVTVRPGRDGFLEVRSGATVFYAVFQPQFRRNERQLLKWLQTRWTAIMRPYLKAEIEGSIF